MTTRPTPPNDKSRNRAMNPSALPALLLSFALAATASAQDHRPVAFTNARLVTISGKTIERGTLVVKNGKIDAIGADVVAPAGARIVDATGMTILPGLVDAWTRTGFQPAGFPSPDRPAGRRGSRGSQQLPMPQPGGGAQARAAAKVVENLYPKQPVFGDMLRAGITSLAVTPSGSGFAGLAALLRLDGKTLDQLTARDDLYVSVGMARDQQTKRILKDTFEKAQKIVEERKKPPEPPKTEGAPETKPGDTKPETGKPEQAPGQQPTPNPQPQPTPNPNPQPTPQPTPQPNPQPTPQPNPQQPAPQQAPKPEGQAAPVKKPEAPKDPNLEVVADLLEGKRRALLQIDSAADFAHWQQVVADTVKFPRTLVVARHDPLSGTLDSIVEQVKGLQCSVLMPLDLTTLPRTRYLISPARRLHDAGIEVGFLLGDSPAAARQVFFRLMELVRYGLPADVALRGVTQVPAKALGIDGRVGTLDVGKDADFLVFRGDPLQPTSELTAVWLAGHEVPQQP